MCVCQSVCATVCAFWVPIGAHTRSDCVMNYSNWKQGEDNQLSKLLPTQLSFTTVTYGYLYCDGDGDQEKPLFVWSVHGRCHWSSGSSPHRYIDLNAVCVADRQGDGDETLRSH